MWPFNRRKQSVDDEAVLTTCNFELARRELAGFFRLANREAASQGQGVAYRKEFVAGWERFAQNPCVETARAWLDAASEYKSMVLSYFVECCPGGRFALYESGLDLQADAQGDASQHLEPARVFLGAITEATRSLAEQIQRELTRDVTLSEEPPPELLWKCLLFVLHLTDRVAFSSLPMPSREHFMSRTLSILAETISEDYLRAEYNAAQRTYSEFKRLLPEREEGTRDTLFWEFGKRVCLEHNDMNPAVITLVSLHAADTFIALEKTFRECVSHS